jgi:hypothetical protein
MGSPVSARAIVLQGFAACKHMAAFGEGCASGDWWGMCFTNSATFLPQ